VIDIVSSQAAASRFSAPVVTAAKFDGNQLSAVPKHSGIMGPRVGTDGGGQHEKGEQWGVALNFVASTCFCSMCSLIKLSMLPSCNIEHIGIARRRADQAPLHKRHSEVHPLRVGPGHLVYDTQGDRCSPSFLVLCSMPRKGENSLPSPGRLRSTQERAGVF